MQNTQIVNQPKKGLVGKVLSFLLYGISSVVIIVFLLHWIWIVSGSSEWQLALDKDGVKIYSLKPAGSVKKQFKAVMRMKYFSMSQFVAGQIENANLESCKELVLGCVDFKVIEPWNRDAMSDTMLWKVRLPGAFSPRENLIKSHITQNNISKAVTIDIMAAPNKVPRNAGSIRTTHIHNRWIFRPIDESNLEVEYLLDMSMGGFFPDYFINMGAVNKMYKWIHDQLPQLVNRERFKAIRYDFIEEFEPGV